jgi:hypothetical protein
VGTEGAEKLVEAESKKTATAMTLSKQLDKMRDLTVLMPSPGKDCLHV